MNVANLQSLLRNQAVFLSDAGAAAKLVGEFNALADGLEPLAAMKLDEMVVLLQQANEYRTTGILPVKVGKAKPARAKPDVGELIATSLATLRELYDRALDETFALESIEAALKPIGKLTVPQLKELARGFDIANVPTKKADILRSLARRIEDRREMHRRGQVG